MSILNCPGCGRGTMKPTRLSQPILETRCNNCGKVEWIGFLPDEWNKYIEPIKSR